MSLVARLGALVVAPRSLARRDLAARDGKASDDLVVVGLIALVLDGAPALIRAAGMLAAGRTNGAPHQIGAVLSPAAPLVLMWLAASALFLLFTARSEVRGAGELGARVTTGYVLASVLVSPIAGLLVAGPIRYVVTSIPWAVAALLFGIVLREALDPERDAPPLHGRAGLVLVTVLAIAAALQVRGTLLTTGDQPDYARAGKAAPAIALPLLAGGNLELSSLRGRRVVLTFWATWCPPCLAELPVLQKLYATRGADLYAINVDQEGPERVRAVQATVKRLGLTMPIALDDGSASRDYAVATIPTLVRIDAEGRLLEVVDRALDEADLRDALR